MAMNYAEKMTLPAAETQAVVKATSAAADEFLDEGKHRPNVVGVGAGVKWKNGEPTGEPAVLVLVTHKMAKSQLSKDELVPAKLQAMQTDVLAVGDVIAGGGVQHGVGIQTLAKRTRPAKGGYSVGHFQITAGTIGTCVYDLLPGASTDPDNPVHGVGIPSRYYILSNNHVLADVNAGPIGASILQPGPIDGGADPADRIARLSRFITIRLTPAVPLALQNNIVDCAVAEADFHDLDREIYWSGNVRGWRRRAQVLQMIGQTVKKTGRTTHFTTGRITAVNATIDVNFGNGRVGRMRDQIVTTNMSAGGDSGSLVLTPDNVAIGLLFAGSNVSMIANQIENVRSLLRVEVAEQIL
ncbi:MAG: hypothetical protein ACFCVH_12820 [Alphaproteobacteria bacterium]